MKALARITNVLGGRVRRLLGRTTLGNPVLNRKIEGLEGKILKLPQVDCPLVHRFAPGVYARQIFMPKDSIIVGHCHRTEHFNIVISGRALVMMDGHTEEIVGPCVFVSKPGVRKVLRIIEDMVWITIHPSHHTDLKKLEKELIVKSPTFVDHAEEIERLKATTVIGSLS